MSWQLSPCFMYSVFGCPHPSIGCFVFLNDFFDIIAVDKHLLADLKIRKLFVSLELERPPSFG